MKTEKNISPVKGEQTVTEPSIFRVSIFIVSCNNRTSIFFHRFNRIERNNFAEQTNKMSAYVVLLSTMHRTAYVEEFSVRRTRPMI